MGRYVAFRASEVLALFVVAALLAGGFAPRSGWASASQENTTIAVAGLENNSLLEESPSGQTPSFEGGYTLLETLRTYGGEGIVLSVCDTCNVLDNEGGGTDAGTCVQAWTPNNTVNQRYSFYLNSDGSYRILSLKSGLAVTADGDGDDARVNLQAYDGRASQRWAINFTKGGSKFTICSEEPSGRYLSFSDAASAGTPLRVMSDPSAASFFIAYVPQASIPDGVYCVTSKNKPLYVLGVETAFSHAGENVRLVVRNDSSLQRFALSWDSKYGFYRIINCATSLNMEVRGSSNASGAYVQLGTKGAGYSQLWSIAPSEEGGGYCIRSSIGGKALSVSDAGLSGFPATMQPANSGDGQVWLMRISAEQNTASNSGKLLIRTSWYGGDDNYEAYHPKVVSIGSAWNGYRFWMAYTPYPQGDATFEDPCVVASNDLVNWIVPDGLSNPIHDTHLDGSYSQHNSDTHLLYNVEKDRLELFWRWIDSKRAIIYRSTSENGVDWSEREIAYYCGNRISDNECISPAIILEDGKYRMWFVGNQKGDVFYAESDCGDVFTWSSPQAIRFPYRESQMKTWHLDVERTDLGYEAVLSAYDEWDNRNRMCLWYSVSQDGISNWSIPKIILMPSLNSRSPKDGAIRWDNMGIYRSCLLKVDGIYYIFYGGTSTSYHHGIGLVFGKDLDNLTRNDVDCSDESQAAGLASIIANRSRMWGGTIDFPQAISKATAKLSKIQYRYTGAIRKPKPKIKFGSRTLVLDEDYTLSYKNNINAGVATVIASGKGKFAGSLAISFRIVKAEQPMTVKVRNKQVGLNGRKRLKDKKTINLIKIKRAQGRVTCKLLSVMNRGRNSNAGIKVRAKSGSLVLPKGLKKGVYRIKVQVVAKGNSNYKPKKQVVLLKVKLA